MNANEVGITVKKGIARRVFPKKQPMLCLTGKEYSWGIGLNPIRQYDELFPEGKKVIRMDIRNLNRYALKSGEYWLVDAVGWRCKGGDVDQKGRMIVYVEGYLTRQPTEEEINEEILYANLIEEFHLEKKLGQKRAEFSKENASRTYELEISSEDVSWKANKTLKWEGGIGWLIDKKSEGLFAEILPEVEKTFRLDVKNPKTYAPKVGEYWKVDVTGIHYTEEDIDATARQIVYVEGNLKERRIAEVPTKEAYIPKRKTDEKPFFLENKETYSDEAPSLPRRKRYSGKKQSRDEESHSFKPNFIWREKMVKLGMKEFQNGLRHEETE